MKKLAGFTLIEVLIVVVIMGVLTAIALPSYRDYLIRGRIPDATSNLAVKKVQIEQWFQDSRTYVGATACNADSTTSKYFTFSCSASSSTGFTLQAVGSGSMAGFTYTINESGTKTTGAVPAGWTLPTSSCWAVRKNGDCV